MNYSATSVSKNDRTDLYASYVESLARPERASGFRRCAKTVMDTTDPDIQFNAQGICDHYFKMMERISAEIVPGAEGKSRLEEIAHRIKAKRANSKYDCIIGLSGGVDSSYVALHVARLGLRPLAIHFDNGWNSELATKNIELIVKKYGFDLETYVVNWEEFRDLQLSFLKASVPNIEIPTDHAIGAILWKRAHDLGIPYLLSGSNLATEGIMPKSWTYDNRDSLHLRGIQKKFGTYDLKTLPHYSLLGFGLKVLGGGLHFIRPLNLVDYNVAAARETLKAEVGWSDYGQKHFESVFTRFYQGFLLPYKFGIDKRKAHLSSLICAGQLSREEAIKKLETPPYTREALRSDYDYVQKKFGLSSQAFSEIISAPVKKHTDYPNRAWLFRNDRVNFLEIIKDFLTRAEAQTTKRLEGKRIAHIYQGWGLHESRIFKESQALEASGKIEKNFLIFSSRKDLPTISYQSAKTKIMRLWPPVAGQAPRLVRIILILVWELNVFRRLRRLKPDIVQCHSLVTLPVGVLYKLTRGCRLVFDAHELETETAESRGFRRILAKTIEPLLLRSVDELICVNESIRDWYLKAYPHLNPSRVHTVRNLPRYSESKGAKANVFRDLYKISDDSIIFLYQGLLSRGRAIQELIKAFQDEQSSHHLVIMGYGELEGMVKSAEAVSRKIHFHQAVPLHELPRFTSSADVGISLIEPISLSYKLCLPNKFFEYLMSGIPVLASDSPDMRAIVEQYQCGWVAKPDAESIRNVIRTWTKDEIALKAKNSIEVGKKMNWELEELTYLKLLQL